MLHVALKEIRKFHCLKQNELAKKLELSTSYLSEIESNQKNISIELLKKYSEIFSIPVSSLILFSENLDEFKLGNRFRLKFTKKIIKIMEWINEKNENKKEL